MTCSKVWDKISDNDLFEINKFDDNHSSFKDNVVGNFGLLDLISALIWIKVRNIHRSFMFLQTWSLKNWRPFCVSTWMRVKFWAVLVCLKKKLPPLPSFFLSSFEHTGQGLISYLCCKRCGFWVQSSPTQFTFCRIKVFNVDSLLNICPHIIDLREGSDSQVS